jgi:hypothetical protein
MVNCYIFGRLTTFLLPAGEKLHIVVAAAAVVSPLKMCEGRRDMGDERGRYDSCMTQQSTYEEE